MVPPHGHGRKDLSHSAPCDPENLHFSVKKHLLGVPTLRRCFFGGSPGPAPGFRAFSAARRWIAQKAFLCKKMDQASFCPSCQI